MLQCNSSGIILFFGPQKLKCHFFGGSRRQSRVFQMSFYSAMLSLLASPWESLRFDELYLCRIFWHKVAASLIQALSGLHTVTNKERTLISAHIHDLIHHSELMTIGWKVLQRVNPKPLCPTQLPLHYNVPAQCHFTACALHAPFPHQSLKYLNLLDRQLRGNREVCHL